MNVKLILSTFLFGGLIIFNVNALPASLIERDGDTSLGTWQIVGESGVNAMHAFLVSARKVVFVDKLEGNALKRPDGISAISAEYDLDKNEARPLSIYTNTFCSAGAWLGNGTLVEAGGDNGDANFRSGRQTVRVYDQSIGDWYELEGIMPSMRWYPTMLSLPSGNVLVVGGSKAATGINKEAINNPTYTYYPPSGTVMEDYPLQFLAETLPNNLYPMVHVMPNFEGKPIIFLHANQRSISFDLGSGKVVFEYPKLPGAFRNYPLTGTSVILPLSSIDNYNARFMICGGNKAYEITSEGEASCGILDLMAENAEWEMNDFGGTPRVMPDATFLVDGTILFVNGARTGFAGYRKGGGANALWVNENPVLFPVLYDSYAKTFKPLASSIVPRMYHSVSTLVPDGTVLVTGSNPQGGVSLNVKYPTEYRVEIFSPPYLFSNTPRPNIISLQTFEINKERIKVYYQQIVTLIVQVAGGEPSFKASLIHHGFITHSQNMGQRFVWLDVVNVWMDTTVTDQYIVTVLLPPNSNIIAPGPSFIYLMNYDAPAYSGVEVLLNEQPA
ncbi:1780_t:CDS:2 [Funneliformis geosporum]|uniref:12927_t:CDS:1 n=1 Tax=Funneliformis geosporum TaxID=1117311 RepID=A0A9W4SV70_9GLOM|nr:1780_t:CDS:2 [Funneliformis geosporum]CAI2180320.1 12927_t:CDS:2 [Funneliformis geosporum]